MHLTVSNNQYTAEQYVAITASNTSATVRKSQDSNHQSSPICHDIEV